MSHTSCLRHVVQAHSGRLCLPEHVASQERHQVVMHILLESTPLTYLLDLAFTLSFLLFTGRMYLCSISHDIYHLRSSELFTFDNDTIQGLGEVGAGTSHLFGYTFRSSHSAILP